MAKALIVGPLPPPVGGIATIVGMLKASLIDSGSASFINSSKPNGFLARGLHPISLASKIFTKCLGLKEGKILFFSSAYKSFWEKCVWIVIAKITGVKVVLVMVDGNFPAFFSSLSSIGKAVVAFFLGAIETLAVQSKQWERYYQGIVPKAIIQIAAAGIDTDFFFPAKRDRDSAGPVKITFVGWMIEAKGIYDLFAAAKLLDERGLSFSLKLIGPIFNNEAELKERLNLLKLSAKVEIAGPVFSRELLRDEYQEADIFVFPSHFEGFPVALLEAISSGLPCVGTNVGGIPDILDGGSGIIVNKKSPEALFDALRMLIEDSELRCKMGCLARNRALHEYSVAVSIDSYRELLGLERMS